jgi:hypothetical protein
MAKFYLGTGKSNGQRQNDFKDETALVLAMQDRSTDARR